MATEPVDARKVERLLTSFEKKVTRAEAQAIRRLARGLLDAQNRLLGQLQGPYNVTLAGSRELGRAVREARARSLLEQVRGLLAVIPPTARADLEELVREGALLGVESANALTTLYDPQLVASFAVVPQEAVLAAASNSYARLLVHGEEFAARASQSIVSGIATGSSWRKVATEIKAQTGITRRHAETIVRTESVQAHDEGHRAAYRDQGIEYVQRLATLDTRVCGYCAARAGNVYKLEDAPATLHPNDRCRNIPWKPEWQQAGLTDDEWTRKHKAGVLEQLGRQGGKPNAGAAPFEKAAGLGAPKPVWSPGDPPLKVSPPKAAPPATPAPTPAPRAPRAPRAPKPAPVAPPLPPTPAGPQPNGIPVSQALAVAPDKKLNPAREAIAAIDRIHGDGRLPRIPLTPSGGVRVGGQYRYRPYQPQDITISTRAEHQRVNTAHEIGHFIDQVVLGDGNNFGSAGIPARKLPEMEELMRVINSSRAIQEIRNMTGGQLAYRRYLIRPEEKFARAYSQYIARKSNTPAFKAELDAMRERKSGMVYYPTQWDDDDFDAIEAAFDRLLRLKGWVK